MMNSVSFTLVKLSKQISNHVTIALNESPVSFKDLFTETKVTIILFPPFRQHRSKLELGNH